MTQQKSLTDMLGELVRFKQSGVTKTDYFILLQKIKVKADENKESFQEEMMLKMVCEG